MKKTLLLICCTSVLVLSACGGESSSNNPNVSRYQDALLVIILISIICIIVLVRTMLIERAEKKFHESVKTMSLQGLIREHNEAEYQWNLWNNAFNYAKEGPKKGRNELSIRNTAEERIKHIRREIADRFPDVITDIDKAKEKAYSVADLEQKMKMSELENKLQRLYEAMGATETADNQKKGEILSSISNTAASGGGDSVVDGFAYTAIEVKKEAVTRNGSLNKAHTGTCTNMAEEADKTKKQLKALYEEIIHEDDPNVVVHFYEIEHIQI